MTGLWSIVTPSASVNHITNPSFEVDATGWTNWGTATGTRTRTPDAALQGYFGYRMDKTGAANPFGAYFEVPTKSAIVSGDLVAGSIYIRIDTAAQVEFQLNVVTAGDTFSVSSFTTGPYEGRLTLITAAIDGVPTTCNLAIRITNSYTGTLDIDGASIEAGASLTAATTYFDGDTPGCYWNGAYHGSTSTRPATIRTGGDIENFDSYAFYITGVNDSGMAGVSHNIDDYALQDGALYRSARTPQRVFTLTGEIIGSSLADLHDKRRALVDLFKNDVTGRNDPFWLYYTGSGETLRIQARYAGGLDGSRSPRDGFSERVSIRFIAADPYWRKTYNVGADITATQTISINRIQARINGEWQYLHATQYPDDNSVSDIAIDNGTVYVVGTFTTINSDGNMSYIAQYNGSSYSAMGTGANNQVHAVAVAPNGDVYAGGAFTLMGGVASTAYIARWDGSAWNALGTGMNNAVFDLVIGPNNVLYVSGSFTTANGVANNRIAQWDLESLSWGSALSSGLDDGIGYALAIAPDGDLYVGGSFTGASSVSNTAKIARWDGSAFNALSTGMNNTVWALLAHPNGHIFVGGDFTTGGGVTVNYITEWTGVTFLSLNGGANSTVSELGLTTKGHIVAGGAFTTMGGTSAYDLAFWNGTTWYTGDQALASGDISALASGGKYELITGSNVTSATASYNNSITNNGTHTTYPRFYIKPADNGASASFDLYQFELYEADKAIRFQPWSFNMSETVIIDTRPGSVGVTSTVTGNQLNSVNRASNLGEFRLLPGSNSLLAFAVLNNATYEISMIWDELFWSADGYS